MNKDKLIAKQQLEIEYLKENYEADRIENQRIKDILFGKFYNCGQPLNDNLLEFNKHQMSWAWFVVEEVKKLRTKKH